MKNHAITKFAALVVSAFLLAGCRDEAAHKRLDDLEKKVETQRKAITQLAQWSEDRQKQVAEQIAILAKEAFKGPQESFAAVDTSGQGFAILESNNGIFLISCKGAETYLDGHKLTLHIGNPYNMSYNGFTLKAKYGNRPSDFPKDGTAEEIAAWRETYTEWEKTLHQKDSSFTETLAPGAWTKIKMILTPSKPEELAYLSFGMATDEVSLRRVNE